MTLYLIGVTLTRAKRRHLLATLLAFELVFHACPGQAEVAAEAALSPCQREVQGMVDSRSAALEFYLLASGTDLSRDAGKYFVCAELPNARYFLVSMTMRVADPVHGHLSKQPVELGFCLPADCTNQDVPALVRNETIMAAFGHVHLQVTNILSTSPSLDVRPRDGYGFVALGVVGVLSFIVIASTLITGVTRRPRTATAGLRRAAPPFEEAASALNTLEVAADTSPNGSGAQPARSGRMGNLETRLPLFVQAFSLVGRNGTLPKLFERQAYKPTDCLNGLRVLSMFWIVLGHTFLMPMGISGYSNLEDIVASPIRTHPAEDNAFFMLIISAEQGVDTFFFISGFLLSHLTLKELTNRGGKMNPVVALGLRYLRLTPSLAFVMMVYFKIVAFLGHGPFAPRLQDSIKSRCDSSWWSELTYTMNFIPFDSDKVCMGWTWYLGDDMIFFFIGLMLLPVYYRRAWMGWTILACLMAISLAVTTQLILGHHLSLYVFDDHYKEYSYWAYSKPYTRIGAYLVGVATAWLFPVIERRGITREAMRSEPRASWLATCAAAVATGVMLSLVFIPSTDYGHGKNSWGDVPSMLFLNFGRVLWAACLAVITVACYYGLLPWTDRVLSHNLWVPFTRLTYGAYLCHPLVIKLFAGTELQYYIFTVPDLFSRFIGNVVLSYALAVIVWCLVERPAITLSSSFFKKDVAKQQGSSRS